MNNKPKSISAVDLFCGVGGLTYGLQQAGIKVNAGIDIDETCEYAYKQNNEAEFICEDVSSVTGEYISSLYPESDIKLLVGCAPCQPFSSHTYKKQNRESDEEWGLLTAMQQLIADIEPEIVSMENVPPLQNQTVFTDFVDTLDALKYHVHHDVLYCPDYGVPQKRRRLVLIASKLGEISLPSETHASSEQNGLKPYLTVRDAIGDLPEITDGQVFDEDPLHWTRKLSTRNKERIQQSSPGGTWLDWEPELRAPCHQRESGQTYKSVYARMEWDQPAPTITTQFYNFGTGRFGHPDQDRALSLREGALLQTFPLDYEFIDPSVPASITRLGVYIGNAVPVQLATVIGQSIQKHLEGISHE